MRLSIVEAIIASLLLILIAMVTTEAGSKHQQRLQFLALWPQSHSHGRSNTNEYARSVDVDVGAQLAPTTTSNMKMDQGNADTGRGFMAKLMLFKSMFQPTPPPPPPPTSNIVIVTQPDYTTTPTTTTTTITTPTTTTTTNSTRGYFTNVVYARQDNSGGASMIVEEPGMTNRIPMAGQFQRPLQKRIRRNRGQSNQNKRRHRLQLEQQHIASTPSRNQQVKRRRTQLQAAAGSIPFQRKNQRRNVVKIPIQNRISNRIDNFDANALNEEVGIVNMAGNDLNTNTRLQQFMNAFRQTQTPIVYNY